MPVKLLIQSFELELSWIGVALAAVGIAAGLVGVVLAGAGLWTVAGVVGRAAKS
jgi:hypothetical protein